VSNFEDRLTQTDAVTHELAKNKTAKRVPTTRSITATIKSLKGKALKPTHSGARPEAGAGATEA
jgi:hypothetical protein